nr:MAG TPA: hypothetical protein [Bacteriophage sp.]
MVFLYPKSVISTQKCVLFLYPFGVAAVKAYF